MLTQLSPPSAEPLSLAEAKLHLRVGADITEDDGLIAALIVTARQQAEHRTGRALVSQQWRYAIDAFPVDSLGCRCPSCNRCSRFLISTATAPARRWRIPNMT